LTADGTADGDLVVTRAGVERQGAYDIAADRDLVGSSERGSREILADAAGHVQGVVLVTAEEDEVAVDLAGDAHRGAGAAAAEEVRIDSHTAGHFAVDQDVV